MVDIKILEEEVVEVFVEVVFELIEDVIEEGVLICFFKFYYNFDKVFIRVDVIEDLDELVCIMIKYFDMIIVISLYIDFWGNDVYNLNLFKNRVKLVVDYLVKKGIDFKWVSFEGFGEIKLLNECVDGVFCFEE